MQSESVEVVQPAGQQPSSSMQAVFGVRLQNALQVPAETQASTVQSLLSLQLELDAHSG